MYTRDEYNDLVLDRANAVLMGLGDTYNSLDRDGLALLTVMGEAINDVSEAIGAGCPQAEIDRLIEDGVACTYRAYTQGRTEPEIALPEAPVRFPVTVRLELDLTPDQAAVLFKEATSQLNADHELGELAHLIHGALASQTEAFGRLL